MKLLKLIFIPIFIFNTAQTVAAQNCKVEFLGTKTLYQKPENPSAAAPAGYLPVFINYVGRHGARHLTKNIKTNYAYQLLFRADSLHGLTEKGQELKQMVLKLEKVEQGNTKFISAEGRAELHGIAGRMVHQYPTVFEEPLNIKLSVTKEIRTAQSADAFFTGINSSTSNKPLITKITDDTNLRFYDFSPAYDVYKKSDAVKKNLKLLQKQERINLIDNRIAKNIFKPLFAEKLSADETEKFTAEIFGFATIVYSLQNEIARAGFSTAELNFSTIFTCEELGHLGSVGAAEDYLKKGPANNLNGIQVKIAVPLLINFIKTTDEFIATGKYNAQLRFAHAETILPFAAILDISSADKTVADLSKLSQFWRPENIAPLSSNIQWVLYRKKGSKNCLIKVLLNEKEIPITGLATKNFPFYTWDDLKGFYLKKLSAWNIKLGTDMVLYLKNLH
ncbi:histidine-type phosphatase [Mucilaginibacter sp.]|uniref:histidine-type phosphatase n=1 Tax=Mucilaginibacter sp. TaxID=1882438 RepID=UPI003B00BC14